MNNWDSKGIKTIWDILDKSRYGNFNIIAYLNEIYGVRVIFLNYENILHKIPNE